MTESLDDKLSAMGSDRERFALWDIEKRELHAASILLKSVRLSEPWKTRTWDRPFQLPPSSSWSYHTDIMGRDIPLPVPVPPSNACSGLQQVSSLLSRIKFEDSTVDTSSSTPSEPFIVQVSAEEMCKSLKSEGDEMEKHNMDMDEAHCLSPDTDQLSTTTITTAATAAAAVLLDDVIDDYSFLVKESIPSRGRFQPAHPSSDSSHFIEEKTPPDEAGVVKLRVVFDGLKRAICDFGIQISAGPESLELNGSEERCVEGEQLEELSGGAGGEMPLSNDGEMEENSRQVKNENGDVKNSHHKDRHIIYINSNKGNDKEDKDTMSADELDSDSWESRHLIGPETLDPDSESSPTSDKSAACRVSVDKYEIVQEGEAIVLSDKVCMSSFPIDVQLIINAMLLFMCTADTSENDWSSSPSCSPS